MSGLPLGSANSTARSWSTTTGHLSAARFVEVTVGATDRLPAGLGARHASAASISEEADAIAVAVSESSFVRIFAAGKLRAEIAPELFLGAGGEAFAISDADVHELPDVGLTIALDRTP